MKYFLSLLLLIAIATSCDVKEDLVVDERLELIQNLTPQEFMDLAQSMGKGADGKCALCPLGEAIQNCMYWADAYVEDYDEDDPEYWSHVQDCVMNSF